MPNLLCIQRETEWFIKFIQKDCIRICDVIKQKFVIMRIMSYKKYLCSHWPTKMKLVRIIRWARPTLTWPVIIIFIDAVVQLQLEVFWQNEIALGYLSVYFKLFKIQHLKKLWKGTSILINIFIEIIYSSIL